MRARIGSLRLTQLVGQATQSCPVSRAHAPSGSGVRSILCERGWPTIRQRLLHHARVEVAPVVRAPVPQRFSRWPPTNPVVEAIRVTEIVQFDTGHGPVLVEVAEVSIDTEHIARNQGGVLQAETRLDEAIQVARPAIRAVLETLRELASEEHVVEFGIKLNAEAGVVVAKTPAEGHLIVKITWRRDTTSEE
jgi:hypothetical protein